MSNRSIALEGAGPSVRTPRRVKRLAEWGFALPTIVILLLISAFPLVYALWLSLNRWNLTEDPTASFIGLANYGNLLQDGEFLGSVEVTAIYVAATVLIETVAGVALALLFQGGGRGRAGARA